MNRIWEWFLSWLSAIPRITITNIVEIIIIAFLVYQFLKFVKNSRSWVLLRGIVIILLFIFLCTFFQLDTILWIIGKFATIAAMMLIVVFQPEIRHALERLGSREFFSNILKLGQSDAPFNETDMEEIIKASYELGRAKTGALIVIEKKESLSEYEKTGIVIDGKITSQLLINIFEHNTPLHDGAVIIRDNLITAATCYLPLSDNMYISKSYGTRHRAAIGISEVTDSVTIVVSEETGSVSVAEGGVLKKMVEPEDLRNVLSRLILPQTRESKFSFRIPLKGKEAEDEGKAD